MKTVREILDAINALEHIEEDEFFELQEALNQLAEECGIDKNPEEDEDDDYYDSDYDDEDEEDSEDDY